MFQRTLFLSFAALVAVSSSGCATIVASRTSPYQIVSSVPGAEVRVNGMPVGRTPTTIEVDRKRPPHIEVSLPGHYAQSCFPRTSVSIGYVLADTAICLVAFPFGCIAYVDAAGAWNDLDDQMCSVNLQPAAPMSALQPTAYAPPVATPAAYPVPPPPPPLPSLY